MSSKPRIQKNLSLLAFDPERRQDASTVLRIKEMIAKVFNESFPRAGLQ
jgi:hypothetical protein